MLASRVVDSNLRWFGFLAIGCAAIGALAGVNPGYGLAAALGVAFTLATLANVTVGLLLFTVLSFFETINSASSGGAASLMKFVGLLLFASWYAQATSNPDLASERTDSNRIFLVLGVALVVWSALSATWSESSGTALSDTSRYALNLLLFPVVLGAVRRREQLVYVLAAFVLGAVLSAMYGIVVPVAATSADAGRLAGSVGDPNDQASVLVAAIPLAFGLAGIARRSPGLRLLALLGVVLSLVGVFNTLSRGGLVSLGCVMVAGVIFGGRWRRWAVLLLVVGSLGTLAYFTLIAPASSTARITSSDTSGRSDLWRIAERMFEAHPITGIGSGNFQNTEIHYIGTPGAIHSAGLIVVSPHVAHNIYLQLAAELGIVGLLLFMGIVLASFVAAERAASMAKALGDQDLELLARSLLLSLVGFMASDVFLSGEFAKQLYLVFALCPAALAIARTQSSPDAELSDQRAG
jgi:putative inorganic carbon (hco3(-)) transporter